MALDKLTQITSTGINSTTPLTGINVTGIITASSLSVSGITTGAAATFDSVDVLGVLTYDDVTNVDALGIVTARTGVHVTSGSVGIGTDNPTEKLDVRGHLKIDNGPVLENHGTGDALRVTTPAGYCSIGANNTSYAHFYTDRDKFFFNKKLIVDQGIFAAYNEDLHLATNSSGTDIKLTILNSNGNIGIGTDNPGSLLHALGSYGTVRIENNNTAQYAASGVELKGPAGDERSTKIIHGNSNAGGTETYFQIEQYNAAGSYVKTLSQYSYQYDYWAFNTGGSERLRITSEGEVLIGTTAANSFNGVGLKNNLIVAGSTSDTDITDNSSAAITISNKDGTAGNTAGLHFAREDTDGDPHYAGASIVTQFLDTQVTGQYPRSELAFLTSTAANNAPSEKMRIYASGAVTTPSNPLFKLNSTATYGAYQSLHISPNVSIAQATAQINVGDTSFATSGTNAYTFVCPVTGIYALHAHITLGDVSQTVAGDAGSRVIWSMAYTLGGGNLPLSNYVEVIDTNVWDYQNASYFDTWYFTAGTRIGMGINTNSGGSVAGHGFYWGAYLLQ